MTSIITFLMVFTVIVTIHEFGHYYFAKKSGVLVREFAIGMGPKIFSTKKKETTYTLRILPIGGYVRLAGRGDDVEPLKAGQYVTLLLDDNGIVQTIDTQTDTQMLHGVPFEVHHADLEKDMILVGKISGQEEISTLTVSKTALLVEQNGTSIQVAPFESQLEQASVFKRMLINFGGPLNNFILGIALFIILAFAAGGVNSSQNRVQVLEEGTAYQSGLRTNDTVLSVNGQETPTYQAIFDTLAQAKQLDIHADVVLSISRDGQQQTITTQFKDGLIGIVPVQDTSFGAKISYGFTQTWFVATRIFSVLASIFTQGFDIQQLGGPVAIAQASGQAATQGIVAVIAFMAMLSINLGIANLLPIPGLDGGKLVLNILEALRGKPISQEKEMTVTLIGAGLLILLMLAVTYNDIVRWFFK